MKKWMVFAAALLFAPLLQAQGGDPEAGKGKATMCVSCHGQDGISTAPIYPNLAGQKEQYLVSSLQAYKNGQREGGQSALMYPMVSGLSEQDILDLAAYYASMPPGGAE